MKQSVPGTTTAAAEPETSLLAYATRNEIEVCLILLDLRNPIDSLSESLSNFNWGRRRRRSCLDAPPPLPTAPSRLSTFIQKTDGEEIEVGKPLIKSEVDDVVEENHGGGDDRTTASPDTPLSFSPSESDEKSNRMLKKASRKRSREELIVRIQELTQRKGFLAGEIENVKKYYHNLKTYNSQLKSIKQEVLNSYPRHYRVNAVSQPLPSFEDPMARRFQRLFGPITAQCHGLGLVNQVGPLGIDLNIPAEEVDLSRPLDVGMAIADKRARFAEARRRRRGLIKIKALRSACGIKLPTSR